MSVTLEEVKKHSTKNDLWLVIRNKVYNISKYLEEHPGGEDVLLDLGGQDATEAFDDIGHSDEAKELMAPFLIGELASSPKPLAAPSAPKSSRTPAFAAAASTALLAGTTAYILGQPTPLTTTLSDPKNTLLVFTSLLSTVLSLRALASPTTGTPLIKPSPPALNPTEFIKLPLASLTHLTHNTLHLVFTLPTPTTPLGLPIGQHVSIRAVLNDKAVLRSYTPISNDTDLGRLELVVKVYPGGLITNYLASLHPGDLVEFRGPKGAMTYHKNLAKHIGMIAGGTGISPMYQLIRAICEDPSDTTTVSLLYANVSEEDILLRSQLDEWAAACPDKFKVYYVLNNPPEGWTGGVGFVSKEMIVERLPEVADDNRVMICGPPGMVAAMKKGLVELGWKKPGPVGKSADQVFCF